MSPLSDRRVHACLAYENGHVLQVVRYDRAGRWWSEFDGKKADPLSVAAAVRMALNLRGDGGSVFLGLPGGSTFDRIVREQEHLAALKGRGAAERMGA